MKTSQKVINQDTQLKDKLLSGAVGEKYQGKQVVVIGHQVVILPEDDRKAVTLVEKLEKQYPDQIPHLISVPRPETYVL